MNRLLSTRHGRFSAFIDDHHSMRYIANMVRVFMSSVHDALTPSYNSDHLNSIVDKL